MAKRRMTHDRSWQTSDRGPPSEEEGGPRFLTVESLGPKREMMKNGYLVCYDVPIARTGWMLYMAGEVPVQPNPTSMSLYVERTADELFAPATFASFLGVGLVNEHPNRDLYPQGVTADNSKELVGGFIQNLRRGKDEDGESEVLLADIVVTHRPFIEAIQSGKREISAGYDAAYETVRPGIGRQRNIIANHIALVTKGRCGPRCAIGDHSPNLQPPGATHMPHEDTREAAPRRRLSAEQIAGIRSALDAQQTLTNDDDSSVHVHVHMGDQPLATSATRDKAPPDKKDDDEDGDRMSKLEKTMDALVGTVTTLGESMKAMMSGKHAATKDGEGAGDMDKNGQGGTEDKKPTADAKPPAGDGKNKTEDSAALATSYQEVVSKAEILVPGFKVPTFDSALPRAQTVDAMCGLRRTALTSYGATEEGKKAIAAMTSDALADLGCQEVAILFNAAAAAKATANNTRATHDSQRLPAAVSAQSQGAPSAAVLNAAHRKYWAESQRGHRA